MIIAGPKSRGMSYGGHTFKTARKYFVDNVVVYIILFNSKYVNIIKKKK